VLSCVGRGLCDGLITRQRSPTKYLTKTAKPPMCGGQGPWEDCRATDDDDDDDDK
jgi:hypothetical protein